MQVVRWLIGVACILGGAAASAQLKVDTVLEGAWFDPEAPGNGLTIDALPSERMLFVAWYTFAPDDGGGQRWYTGLLEIEGAVASGPLFFNESGDFATGSASRVDGDRFPRLQRRHGQLFAAAR